ncbi:hypothetical protein T439DRAFT_308275 [Meredithblackwellia eburnea MCA 4105]
MSLLKKDEHYDEMVGAHHLGEGYSERSKIPTISDLIASQKHLASQNLPKEQEPAPAPVPDSLDDVPPTTPPKDSSPPLPNEAPPAKGSEPPMTDAQREKKELMDKATAQKEKPAQAFQSKGEREVLDPVTLQKVTIKDAELKDYKNEKLFKRGALDPDSKVPGPAANPVNKSSDISPSKIAPSPAEPGNVLLQQFPPPYEKDTLSSLSSSILSGSYYIIAILGAVWFFTAFKSGFVAFVFRSSLIGAAMFATWASHGIVTRKIEKELERVRLDLLKQRADQYSPPTPESTEWLNAFTATIWPLINPEMFQSVVDMIEDVMQASLPGFIDAVKVDDFTIGKNALRIVSMRGLPDQPQHKDYPKEEWIDQGSDEHALDPNKKKQKPEGVDKTDGVDQPDLDQSGDYVNLEVSFAYFAPPGTKKLQGQNISLLISFFIGAFDWFHLPIPIWIAVENIVGTVRLRLQIVPDPPFIRNLTFTLMGVPKIESSAIPLAKALPNVLDLPLISGFVQSSIAAACSVYCAPQSMTLNLGQILSGDGVKKDTKALGVLAITIHYAEDLSAQDDNGFSDPYVVLAYAKFGKPLYSSRIISHELNPVWEETAYLLVSDDEIRAKEDLSVQLWDSDALTADDLVGRIKVPLIDLMLEPNVVHKRQDKLMGFEDADSMSGTLTWSVAYYDKAMLNPALKKEPGIDHDLPKELQDRPELKVETTAVDTAEEADVRRTPPDPRYSSGVLSVVIHQINSLERQNLKGASGKDREGQAGQDTDDPSEDSSNLPSSYCEIVVNDDMIYKTRTKQYSAMPFFEAGTEHFVRDWKETVVRVVVRDARLREHDPILGIVNLPLKDLLKNASEVTRLYALQDGVGFGRISVSVLFKGVQMELPKELAGWDTGTVCITSDVKVEPVQGVDFDFKEKKLFVTTLEAAAKIPASAASISPDGTLTYTVDEHLRLPAYNRYSSALFFDYGGVKFLGLGKKYDAFASLWLKDLVDDEEKEIRIPIIVADDSGGTMRQNYISDQTEKTHKYQIVGWLITTVVLDSGLDADHEAYATTQTKRHEFDTWNRIEGQAAAAELNSHAMDDGVIDKDEQKAIDKAHKVALESRHRGVMQFAPYRTAVWMKDGVKDRTKKLTRRLTGKKSKNSPQDTVATETGS